MDSRDDWNQHWDRYAETAARNPAQLMRHALITKIITKADHLRSQTILDIGSGQGDLLVKLHKECPEAVLAGFELSAKGVEISRRKLPQASFHEVDLFNVTSEISRFENWATDAVCSEVLEHVDVPGTFLQAAAVYLKRGARLIVTVPGGPMSAFDRHIGHRQHFTSASIGALLGSSGFAVERVYLSGFPFFNVYRLMVILRGKRLVADGTSKTVAAGWLAKSMLAMFGLLFRLNVTRSPFGWQVVAVARKI
jgi:trans-aconitate methyltransferase